MPISGSKPSLSLNPDLFVWAFIPYWVEDGRLSAYTYDTPETKLEYARAFKDLGVAWAWQPIVKHSLFEVVTQVASCAAKGPTVVFNFCDGDDANLGPGSSVVRALEAAEMPFTGADSTFFQISTSKIVMKECFVKAGVPTAPYALLPDHGSVEGLCERLKAPLFVKPSVSAGSYGISVGSVVHDDAQLAARRDVLRRGEYASYFADDQLFVERFVEGAEFTVFVGGYWDDAESFWNLPPAYRAFDDSIPSQERFLSYDRYWALYKEESPPPSGLPFYTYQPSPPALTEELVRLARAAYAAVQGTGYARVDIRQDTSTGELLVLEVNANCGLSGDDESSCGSILQMAGLDFAWLMGTIVQQALRRAQRKALNPR